MAKSSSGSSIARFGGLLAFVAIIIAGIVFLISAICNLFNINLGITGTLNTIKNISLLVSVVISGYIYLSSTKMKNKTLWTAMFWIFVILAILGYVNI